MPLKNGAPLWYRIQRCAVVAILMCGMSYHRILLLGVFPTKTMTLALLYNEHLLVLINRACV